MKYLLTLSFLSFFVILSAQYKKTVKKTTAQTSTVKGGVIPKNLNVVYRGVDNPIDVFLSGATPSSITLETDNGEVEKIGTEWIYRAGSGDTTTFTISGKRANGSKISTTIDYRIKNVPTAEGQIRGKNSISLPLSNLSNQTISVDIPNFEFPFSFEIVSFKLKIPNVSSVIVQGNTLREARNLLSRVRVGDQIVIHDINVLATGVDIQKNISPILIKVL